MASARGRRQPRSITSAASTVARCRLAFCARSARRLRRLLDQSARRARDDVLRRRREPQYASRAKASRCTRSWPITFAITKRIIGSGQPPQPCSCRTGHTRRATCRTSSRARQHGGRGSAHRGKGRRAGLKAARDAFYRGDIAQKIARYHHENGGWVTRDDLASFEVRVEPTVTTTFHGIELHACGPWSQGPVLPQALNVLAGYDLKAMKHNSVAYIHHVTEALKLAFADRHRYYGDPRFVDVPIDALLSKDMRPLAVRCSRRTRRPRACRLPET